MSTSPAFFFFSPQVHFTAVTNDKDAARKWANSEHGIRQLSYQEELKWFQTTNVVNLISLKNLICYLSTKVSSLSHIILFIRVIKLTSPYLREDFDLDQASLEATQHNSESHSTREAAKLPLLPCLLRLRSNKDTVRCILCVKKRQYMSTNEHMHCQTYTHMAA